MILASLKNWVGRFIVFLINFIPIISNHNRYHSSFSHRFNGFISFLCSLIKSETVLATSLINFRILNANLPHFPQLMRSFLTYCQIKSVDMKVQTNFSPSFFYEYIEKVEIVWLYLETPSPPPPPPGLPIFEFIFIFLCIFLVHI